MKELYEQIIQELSNIGTVFHGSQLHYIYHNVDSENKLFFDLNTGALFKIIKGSETKWYFRAREVQDENVTIEQLEEILNQIQSI